MKQQQNVSLKGTASLEKFISEPRCISVLTMNFQSFPYAVYCLPLSCLSSVFNQSFYF